MSKNRIHVLKSKLPFTKVPNKLWQLGPSLSTKEKRIYHIAIGVYLLFAGSGEGFDPGLRYISECLGCSKTTAANAIDFLVIKNMIVLHSHDGRGNRKKYEFTRIFDWKVESLVPYSDQSKEDTSSENKDTIPPNQRHPVSSLEGHNNELNQRTKIMNDDEDTLPTPSSFSFQEEEPKGPSNWFETYFGPTTPSWLEDYQYLLVARDYDKIFEAAYEVFIDSSTKKTFRQCYLPALENAISRHLNGIIRKQKVPFFCRGAASFRHDHYLKRRFKECDSRKPYMQFNGSYCQELRHEAKKIFRKYESICEDKRIERSMECCNPTSTICEIIGFADYIGILPEIETKLLANAELHLCLESESQCVLSEVLKSWLNTTDHRRRDKFYDEMSVMWCDLWLKFSQKAKHLVPQWADRDETDFFHGDHSDVTHLQRLCNTNTILWEWEARVKAESIEDTLESFLKFISERTVTHLPEVNA